MVEIKSDRVRHEVSTTEAKGQVLSAVLESTRRFVATYTETLSAARSHRPQPITPPRSEHPGADK
jgi:hypothetical protein